MVIDQRKLENRLIFAGSGTVSELLSDLASLAPLEAKLRKRPSRARWASLGVFVLCAAAAVLSGNGRFTLAAVVIPIGLLIWSVYLESDLIIHDRVEVLRLALDLLGHDAGRTGEIRRHVAPQANQREGLAGKEPSVSQWQATLYKDPWLTLNGYLPRPDPGLGVLHRNDPAAEQEESARQVEDQGKSDRVGFTFS